MFLQDNAVKKYLQKKLGVTPTELTLMNVSYYEEIPQIILNEILLYLEKKEDQTTIDELNTYLADANTQINPQPFTNRISDLYHNTPEIYEAVQDRIEEMDSSLTDDLVENMTTEDLVSFLKDGVEDIKELERNIEKLKQAQTK